MGKNKGNPNSVCEKKKLDHNVIIFLILQLLQILFLFDCNLQAKIYLPHWKAFSQSEYIFPSVYSEVMFQAVDNSKRYSVV